MYEHTEYVGLAYGYPLSPARRVNMRPDSLAIETSMTCTDLTARIMVVSRVPVGLRSVRLDSAVNAHVVRIEPAVVSGEVIATIRVAPIDTRIDASGVIVITDRTLTETFIPYSYVAERLDITPSGVLDFGALTPNEPVTREVVVRNPVSRAVTITSVDFARREFGYSIASVTPSLPATIAPGGELRVVVALNPTVDGRLYQDSLVLKTDCSQSAIVVRAETVKPLINVNDVDFGTLAVGQIKRKPMTISNVGRGFITFATSGTDVLKWIEQKFYVDQTDIERIRTARIGPDSSITVMVTFLGGPVGVYRDDARVFASTRENRDVSIWTATVVKPGPQIAGHPFGVNWVTSQNECTKNDVSEYSTVLPVFNTGTAIFDILDIKLIGADADAGFFVKDASIAAENVIPYTRVRPVAGTDTHRVYQRISFRPSEERSYSAMVRIVTINPLNNAIDSADAILLGTAVESHIAATDLTYPTTEFLGQGLTVQSGVVRITALPTRELKLTSIDIMPDNGEFVITGPPDYLRTYAPNEHVDLTVEFRPNGPGDRLAQLFINGDHSTCDDSVATLAGSTFKRDTLDPGSDTLNAIARGFDFGLVAGCADSNAVVTLRNTSTKTIRVTGITLTSGSPEFAVVLPDLPLIVAENSEINVPVQFTPVGAGVFNGEVTFDFALDDGGVDSIATRVASLVGRSEPVMGTASIAKGYRTVPGGSLRIPVMLDQGVDAANVKDVVFELLYERRMMLATIDGSDLGSLVKGTRLDGWNVAVLAHRELVPGADRMLLSMRFTAPSGMSLKGTGALMNIDFKTFIGDTMETALPFTIVTPGLECTEITTTAGAAALDSICGLSFRIVDATGVSYALQQNAPNPFNPSTDIRFSVGLDGDTKLEVYDVNGTKITTLVDAYLIPGTYSVTWDAAAYPSGLYYYRVSSGVWSRTNAMILKK